MQRRDVLQMLALAALTAPALRVQEAAAAIKFDPKAPKPTFVMLVHPDMVLLDLVPALTAFKLTMGDVQLVWKDRNPVSTDVGVDVRPTATLAEAHPAPDVLYIPGGIRGTVACMQDPEVIAFVEKTGASAHFVTSACTGSLLLGAAGLLEGYRATGHWQSRHVLPHLGAILEDGRVVRDRNRITAGGVTAGLDFGLVVASLVRDEEWAKSIQLILEYAPEPPFDAGTPVRAGTEITAQVSDLLKPSLGPLDKAVAQARKRLQL
ncbi:MAG: DJ-1/PfpI family protein [Aquamicrobium sp.]|uniref:DJ-1/PfpI family protein n=1 Tax=Mesorhizobium sp. Pch-S TaxID=2082387 RepID=UPI0010105F2A|nr:DJ-1/PfpI family protein [Mesorhizobium sp. Pch-S]MBR2690473.1 DJ-1/PfpI family protein [Aquamicrobium sp.]QAZ47050.1 DJ-1/PfpI family protein [Mesorhizobium sp. Pch-S]